MLFAAKFNKQFSASILPKTVGVLRAAGLKGHSVHKKFFVSAKNKKLRLSLWKSMKIKLKMYWNNVLFADESKFKIFGFDGHIIVWRIKNGGT